jgi:endothelin-converting enzyme
VKNKILDLLVMKKYLNPLNITETFKKRSNRMTYRLGAIFFAALLLFTCNQQPGSGIEQANLDTSVRPQDNLYQYVNGKWLDRTEIPADRSNYGSFTELTEQNEKRLRMIIEDAANQPTKEEGSEDQKVGDFYLSYMDTSLLEELQLSPAKEELAKIAAVASKPELVKLFAHLIKTGVQTPLYFYINQDQKKSDEYIVYCYQSGLGLPDRDYYFKTDEKSIETRDKYRTYIQDLLTLGEFSDVEKAAEVIMAIETELAKGHWTRVENRDREKGYNKYTIEKLEKLVPSFGWTEFVAAAEIPDIKEIIIRQPTYLQAFNKIFKKYSTEDWKTYFNFKLLDNAAPFLNQDFVDLHFDFNQRTLSGVESLSPRWKRGVNLIDDVLGEAVGKLYVQKYFKPEAKQRMVELVENLRSAYAERIKQLDWMTPETKEAALEKLGKFRAKVGYPDKWKDYSELVVKKDELFQNYLRANITSYHREMNKLGKPIDREEWFMTPQTVNAYYNPSMNEVVFPAAILQPPFFNMAADDAVNYGAIGAVIGHEMTHGFDDQGRKSDGDGNLRDWWTESDAEQFKKRSQYLVDQFDKYVAIDTLHVNGQLTLGENIADLGGLTIAYYAYQMSLDGKPAPVIDGWTGEQRFFMGWAQIWRRKYRDEELRKRLLTDPHSPSQFRVEGPMINMPEFYEAFGVTDSDKMYLAADQRASIW